MTTGCTNELADVRHRTKAVDSQTDNTLREERPIKTLYLIWERRMRTSEEKAGGEMGEMLGIEAEAIVVTDREAEKEETMVDTVDGTTAATTGIDGETTTVVVAVIRTKTGAMAVIEEGTIGRVGRGATVLDLIVSGIIDGDKYERKAQSMG
jgi:hypothetical protein